MLNRSGDVIYVGKAKNLSKRVASYFSGTKDIKTEQLVAHIDDIAITVTRTEEEAFLLELELIKQLQPKYNIIFKDAKSYPFIKITVNDDYPQLLSYRGNRQEAGEYYGPYPSARSAREGLELLQSIFCLRQCDETFFRNRKRPCLQYQLKRCSASCVGLISKQDYLADVVSAKTFLQGKTSQIIDNLIIKMEAVAKELQYERASQLRDQIITLRKIQKHQVIIDSDPNVNVDVLGIYSANETACVHLLSIRGGCILGSKQYFPKQLGFMGENLEAEILEAFILQHYSNSNNYQQKLTDLIVSINIPNKSVLGAAISKLHGRKININYYARGDKSEWIKMAQNSAKEALLVQVAKTNELQQACARLSNSLGLKQPINFIECFDVSHTQGTNTMGACVAFSPTGALRENYRRYNISKAKAGDDYAALAETLERHYSRLLSLNGQLPDLILIDGGKGQLAVAEKVIKDRLKLKDITLLGVAKGKSRKISNETLYLSSKGHKLILTTEPGALRLIQQIRDEAHRFVITGHRAKRDKKIIHSSLEQITGIGLKRRRELLKQLGGFKEVSQATVQELARVPGIGKQLAQKIYDALHKGAHD